MREELNAILEKESFTLDTENTRKFSNILEFYIKKINDLEVIITSLKNDPIYNLSAVGTETAFFAIFTSINLYNPDLVINMGYAGSMKTQIGTVCIAENEAVFHRREMIVPSYMQMNEGHFKLPRVDNLVRDLSFSYALVGTSNSFVKYDDVAYKKGFELVEMELSSVAKACSYFNKPLIGVKLVSDNNLKETRGEEFIKSLENLKVKFNTTYNELVNFLGNKNLSDL